MNRMLIALCFTGLCFGSDAAAEPPASRHVGRDSIRVAHDHQSFVSTVTVPAKNGRIVWADVLRGLSRVQGYDDRTLGRRLPSWSSRANGTTTRFAINQLNRSLGRGIQMRVVHPQARGAEPALVIELDRQAILASQRHIKKNLRDTLLPSRYDRRAYGIVLDNPAARLPEDADLVIFVHGLNSHPHAVRRLSGLARQHGLAVAEFHYPNDQAIEESGQLLSAELKNWKRSHPRHRVSLVTHSMGGLVARVAIENPRLDPGNVERLIMVAPPNHGSALAQFAFGLDIWEYLDAGNRATSDTCLFYSTVEDGLSEATVDLQPGSIFLTKLNRRSRNPRVEYSIFLGTGGPCTREELDDVRSKIRKTGNYCSWARFFGSKLDPAIADLDEVVGGYGDGAVAVKRGRLDGVQDTVVMDFGHISVLHAQKDPEVQKVYAEVLERLTDR